ncbi:MAG TPA: S8 family serine peptidase [Candidatus Thermoplasmatota archaeon]|nr:S8 family serine peptidase [Candidatus Thermoplasmatota archaeon]
MVLLLAVPVSGCFDALPGLKDGAGAAAWPLEMTGVDLLHNDRGLTGKGVRIAIIDTGIDAGHDEFQDLVADGRLLWKDLVNGRKQPYDDAGHGTHVAGIIASQGEWSTVFNRGFYLKGVAPGATLIVIKAIGANGQGDEATVARAINIAVENEAQIIVLSLGGETRKIFGLFPATSEAETAVKAAVAKGVYVVAAAGNEGDDGQNCRVTSPASVREVIAVGAVDEDKKIGDFSCGGGTSSAADPDKKPELVAPGVAVLGPWKGNSYMLASGTSQAAPIVGGALALLLEAHPELALKNGDAVRKVKQTLMATAEEIGPLAPASAPNHHGYYGYGLLRADSLLAAYDK